MIALGQERPFSPDQANGRFAPTAVIRHQPGFGLWLLISALVPRLV